MPAPADTPRPAPMRRLALMGLVLIAAIVSCRDVTGPGGARFARGLSWNAIFPPPLRDAGGTSSGVVNFDRVHVLLHHSDGSVALDTTIDYPSGADSVTVSLAVRLLNNAPAAGEQMSLDLGYVDAAGDTVFKGGPIQLTAAPPPVGGGVNPPVQVPVTYSGVGASAKSVVIAPRTQSIVAGGPFVFTAAAKDSLGNTLAGTPVIWTSLDPTIATIAKPDSGAGSALTLRGSARILAQLLTGATDTVRVTVTLPASQLIKPTTGSGDGQSATAGTVLSQPIVVKVGASDAVGVAGTPVTFTVSTGGGSVSPATAVSDSNGLAQTTWTLGTGSGTQSVTATVASLTNQQLTYTANGAAGAATKLVFARPPATTTAAALDSVVVYAEDANGNIATSYSGTVSLALNPVTAGGTLVGVTSASAVVGIAPMAFAIAKAFTGYTIVASASGLTSATSAPFNVVPGTAKAIIPVSGIVPPQTGVIGSTLPSPIVVRVVDTVGNGIAGKTVTFGTIAGSGSVTPTSVVTDASGNASTTWTLGTNPGVDTATVAVSGLTTVKVFAGALPAVHVWTGANSTSWTDPGNWFPGTVPAASDSVLIPAVTNNPTISSNVTVRTLGSAVGASITVSTGDTLTITGTFANAGGTLGGGATVLSGTGSFGGVVAGSLIVSGNYTLGGPLFSNGNVTITGSVVFGGKQMVVAGLFGTSGNGTFTMTNTADTLVVRGNATFAGGSTVGKLTNGAIGAYGNVLVSGVATSFAPSGNSTLAMLGTTGQTFVGITLGTTTLQNFIAANADTVTMSTLVTIMGNATIGGPVIDSMPLFINGTLTDPPVDSLALSQLVPLGGLTLNNATTPLSNTFFVQGDVIFTGSAAALQGPLEVTGSVIVSAGNLAVNGQLFLVNGAFATIGSGTLTMNNMADTMVVVGPAIFDGGAEAGLLTNGALGMLTGLTAVGPGQFSASGNHTTYFAANAGSVSCGCPALSQALGVAPRLRPTTKPAMAAAPRPSATVSKSVAVANAVIAEHHAAGSARASAARAKITALRAARRAMAAKWPSRPASIQSARVAGSAARALLRPAPKSLAAAKAAAARVRSGPRLALSGVRPGLSSSARPSLLSGARQSLLSGTRPALSGARIATTGTVRSSSGFILPTVLNDTAFIAFGDTTGNQFANVHVVGVINWETPARAAGNIYVDSTGLLVGSGRVSVGDTMYVSNYGAVGAEAVELFTALADSSGEFDADTTIFSGSTQLLPSLYYTGNVVVNSMLSTISDDWGAEVDGTLSIVNSGQIRIGGIVDSTCTGCEADLYADGAFQTLGNGTLRMTDTTTSYLYFEVDDSAYFAGGSTAGLLTQGNIYFYGNFRQAGSPSSFAATSPNQSYFDLYLNSADTITFANPGYGASHFGDFYVETGDYYLASNVFADGSLNTGCITCALVHRVHTLTPGTSMRITSKGADVGFLALDGVSWDLQDGYPVFGADSVDFANQDSTGIQFSIERASTTPIGPNNVFTNWYFETKPQFGVGLYLQVTETDSLTATSPLIISFSPFPQLFGNFGGATALGGAQILGWNFGGGGGDAEVSDVTSWLGRRLGVGGTPAAPAGSFMGRSSETVTPLRALRF